MDSAAQPAGLARAARLVPYALLVLAVSLAFGGACAHRFLLWDDVAHVSTNPGLDPPSWAGLARFWSAPYIGMYVPVSYTWYTLLAWISRALRGGVLDPLVFHAGSVSLHAVCSCLVFRLLRRCVRSDKAALAGALVFALHPLQVESVAWISEARGLLATALGLCALELYVASSANEVSSAEHADHARMRRRARREYAVASVCFALALLAKPSAVSFVLAAAVLDRWIVARPLARSAIALAPWAVIALGAIVLTKVEQSDEILSFVTPVAERPFVALDALAFYACKLALPLDLVPDYGRTPRRVLEQAGVRLEWVVAALVVAALALIAARAARGQRRFAVAGGALFVAGVAPVLGLVPFVYQDISTVADRYVYLALLGPALLSAWVSSRGAPWIHAVVAIALACGIVSRRQTAIWADTETLFQRTLEVNPRSAVAESNTALALSMRGDNERAIEHYERALAIDPRHAISHNNLGMLLFGRGDVAGSIVHFHAALDARPKYVRAHVNLGIVLRAQGDFAGAEAEEREALRLQPESPDAHTSLADVLLARGALEDAIAEYEAALALHEADADAHKNLAFVLAAQGRGKLAAEHYRAALRARPGWSEVEVELAWLLATHRNPDVRNGAEAVALAEHADRTSGGSARSLDALAAAYAEVGRFDDAERTARAALERARATDTKLAARIEARCALYAAHQPFRRNER